MRGLKPEEEGTMRGIFSSGLLEISMVGSVRAQQATGTVAEEAKREVMQFEKDKIGSTPFGGRPRFCRFL
jgi:hypothetical protein